MSKRRRAAADDKVGPAGLEPPHVVNSDDHVSTNLVPRILSGSVGSIITALAVTPLEVVKIRQQSHGVKPISYSNFSLRSLKSIGGVEPCRVCGTIVMSNGLMECSIPVETTSTRSAPQHTSGTFRTLVSIFKHEGWSGLYAGLKPTLLMSVPNTVFYFTAYDEISSRLRTLHTLNNNFEQQPAQHVKKIEEIDNAKRQAYIPLVAGSTSRLLASLSTAPLELVRTRQASAIGNGEKVVPGMVEEFRLLLRTNGVSSLFTGLAPTLWRDVPFSAIYWLFLENFRNGLSDSKRLGSWGGRYYKNQGIQIPSSVEVMHSFVSGAGAGALAAFATTPFDVVKTRRQMSSQPEVLSTSPGPCDHYGLKEYSISHNNCQQRSLSAAAAERGRVNVGTFGHMREIFKDEGLSGLWRGNTTRMVKVAPACAVMISCYEFGKRVFGEML
jgi:solute carrier family 25 protein 39/40